MDFFRNIFGVATHPPATGVPSSHSHPRVMEDPFRCPRTETVRELAHILDDEQVVLVRGTPTSGKTTLAKLLDEYYERHDIPSVLIRSWPKGGYNLYTDILIQRARRKGHTFVTENNIDNCNIVFIIDEAQMSYHDQTLWLEFIKSQISRIHGPRVCLFCSYGSPTGGATNFDAGSPVGFIGIQKRVSLTVSNIRYAPSICLFYNRAEFDDVVRRLCADIRRPLPLDDGARDYIFDLTNCHPGAVEAVIDILKRVYRSEIKHEGITVGVDHIASLLDDEELSFDLLALTGFLRCFPPRNVDTAAANVLRAVLANQNVPLDRDDKGTEICYRNGWLHAEPLDIDAQTIVCIFPTKLHLKFVEYYLTGSSTPFPYQKFPSIESLAEAIFRGFSLRNLASVARLGTGVAARPVEASYQDEFYRSLQQVLGFSAKVTSEWTGDKDNRIDFRIDDPRWGIEILRDGNHLIEHCDRFVGNGRYTPWIQNGSLQDWLVIDCRTSFPRENRVPGTKLWRAVFASDYSSVQILDASNQIVVDEFSLMS